MASVRTLPRVRSNTSPVLAPVNRHNVGEENISRAPVLPRPQNDIPRG
jgi:hypothetical protein